MTEWGLKTCKKVQEDYNEESWTPLKPLFRRPGAKNGAAQSNGAVQSNGAADARPGSMADGTQQPQYT